MNEMIAQHAEMFTLWRRDLHQHPELGFEEQRTSQLIAEKLRSWGFDEVHTGIAETGVVGVLKGKYPAGRAIGLRADMDALPMDEANNFAHASCHKGKMHACGHDGHTTMALAAAWYLAKFREFRGTVNFIFQPAEEGRGGAQAMIDAGLFERFPCDRVYGMHNMPGIPVGEFHLREGPLLASADAFDITITGKGGHGAMPQLTIDPTLVMSSIVMNAQTIVSRNISPLNPVVISFTDLHAGSGTHNVIPSTALLRGSVRAFSEEVRQLALARLSAMVEQVATSYGAAARLTIVPMSYPPTINHHEPTQTACAVAERVVGKDKVNRDCQPLTGSEDFSFMLRAVPGCYLLIGNGCEGEIGGVGVHKPDYDFNDAIIPTGASFFVEMVKTELPAAAT